MTAKEIINIGPSGVRNNVAYMVEYKKIFFEQFNYEPECPTCGSTKDWNLFKSFANGNPLVKPIQIMSDKTFKIKDPNSIYSYDYEDKKTGRLLRKRTFGYLMSEDFASAYLTHGSKEEIEERRKNFKILPEKLTVENDNKDLPEEKAESLYGDKISDFKAYALKKKYPQEEYKDIKTKADFIAYLDSKELEKAI